jgi:hypothetical protein
MSDQIISLTDNEVVIITPEEDVVIIESIESGPQGPSGQDILLQKTATHIQWKYENDEEWTDLVALSELQGEQGEQGDQGLRGLPGDDGTEIELQITATYIQWRYVGGSWVNLVALADLKGDQGQASTVPGPAGVDGLSAYEVYLATNPDPELDEYDWLDSLKGDKGDAGVDGLSAYEVYLATNPDPELDEYDWLLSLNDRKTIYIQQWNFTEDVSTGDICGSWPIPFSGTILSVGANVVTAGVTGTMVIDIHKNGTSIMTTDKIGIETGEIDSEDATTQPALTADSFVAGDLFTFNVDAIQTTPAKGLTVRMVIKKD